MQTTNKTQLQPNNKELKVMSSHDSKEGQTYDQHVCEKVCCITGW